MKKRIMFLESRYDSFYGAQKSMLKLIKSLNKKIFEYKVVTTKNGKLKNALEQYSISVDVVELGKKANVFGGKILTYTIFEKILVVFQILFYNLKLITYIYKNNIDIVYVNDIRALVYSFIASKILRKKIIWYVRENISPRIANIGFRFADNIITIAEGVLREVPSNKINKYKHKLKNIYTGFDFEQFKIYNKNTVKKEFGISENDLVIGYLGSINERKGIDLLVEAFIDLSYQYANIQLLIVGDVSTGYEDYWGKLSAKLYEVDVKFKHIPYTTSVSRIYSSIDIFVLPSRSEGLPRVVVEAMAHQLAVIATDVGGTNEIIENESLGVIVKRDEKEELICGIKKLIINDEYRNQVAIQGYQFVRSKFTEKKFIREINEYFNSI